MLAIGFQGYLRMAGCMIIMLACLGSICAKECEFRENKKQLEELRLLLSMLQNEICYLRLPLIVALKHCSEHIQEPYQTALSDMIKSLSDQQHEDASCIWQEIMQMHKKNFALQPEVYELLVEMGELFRANQTGLQQELINIYQDRLSLEKEHFESLLPQRKRVNRIGTALGGIFIMILFL